MANVTAQEQLMLELVNRARMNPAAEAAKFGVALGSITTAPKQVLAMNDKLVSASDIHSKWMLDTDTFSHTGSGGSNPGARMAASGYSFGSGYAWGENISYVGTTGTLNTTTSIIQQHENLFKSSGHRANILSDNYREIGIGQEIGKYGSFNASMVTQDFARSGTKSFVTGVVYSDTTTNDNFYTVGEGKGGVVAKSVTDGTSDTSSTAGGYELALSAGAKTFQIGGATVSFTLGQSNIKLDLVNGKEIWTNASLKLVSGATEAHLLGIEGKSLTGSTAADKLYGNAGSNSLSGGAGNDTISGGSGADKLAGGAGKDALTGGAGADQFIFKAVSESGPSAAARDVISDFAHGTDKLNLSAIDANSTTTANDAFSLLAGEGSSFSGAKGQIIWDQQGTGSTAKTIVMCDTNGDKVADFHIELKGLVTLTSGDFIL